MSQPLDIVDFHCHHVPARFEITGGAAASSSQHARRLAMAKLLGDEGLLLADIDSGDISARVVNAPAAQIADAEGWVPHDVIRALNDDMAALAGRYPGRIVTLATIDAYDGERAARELERAVRTLGLKGVFVDCARGDKLIDAPEARPTLQMAAHLGVPVFVHPINPRPLISQMEPYGRVGTLLARGTANSAALVALLEGGVFRQFPDLKVVVTALAFGGLAMAAAFPGFSHDQGIGDILRRNVFIDTMGFHPALIRAAVEIVGPANVLVGSDWPIVNDEPIRPTVERALSAAGLPSEHQALIASGNARRLVGLST